MLQSGPTRRSIVVFRVVAVALCALSVKSPLAAAEGRTATPTSCPSRATETVDVIAIDEHLGVTLADGRVVRPVGLEAPRVTEQAPARPREVAATFRVRLQGQPAGIAVLAPADRWATAAAVIFAGDDDLAHSLLTEGLVRFQPEPAARACRESLLAAEAMARMAQRGVWADPALQAIAADDMVASSISRDNMVVVEGAVVSVGETATRLFLNLGRTRGQFAISASKRDTALMDSEAIRGARRVGARLRVRGLLDRTAGLRIDLSDADALELLPGATGAETTGR